MFNVKGKTTRFLFKKKKKLFVQVLFNSFGVVKGSLNLQERIRWERKVDGQTSTLVFCTHTRRYIIHSTSCVVDDMLCIPTVLMEVSMR